MDKRVCIIVAVLAIVAAVAVGAPVDSTTASSLHAIHNETVMSSVCVHMIPGHGDSTPQADEAPFAISLLQKTANPGDTVQINIQGRGAEQFKGVYIQGRYQDTPVGQFIPPGDNSPPVRITDCPPGHQNAASYISRTPISQLVLQYIVPDVPEVVFRTTFVKSYSAFWTGVESERLVVVKQEALE